MEWQALESHSQNWIRSKRGKLIYDSKRKRLLLHGGFWSDTGTIRGNTKAYGELRELVDGKWRILDVGSTQPMSAVGGFYDVDSDKVVVFGRALEGPSATWVLSNGQWSKLVDGPGDLVGFVSAFDPDRKSFVLSGGFSETASNTKTWEFREGRWAVISETALLDLPGAVMVYDEGEKKMVAYGGSAESGPATDTWAWDGKSWRKLEGRRPGPFDMPAMAYDAKRGVTVLVGAPLVPGSMQVWERPSNGDWKQVR